MFPVNIVNMQWSTIMYSISQFNNKRYKYSLHSLQVKWLTPSTPQAIPSLFQIELTSLWISQRIFLTPALITQTGFDKYLIIYEFLANQQPSQAQRHSTHALVVPLYVFLSA